MKILVTVFRLRDPRIPNREVANKLAANVVIGGLFPEGDLSVCGTWVGRRVDDETLALCSDRPDLCRAARNARNFATEIEERQEKI